MFFRRMKLIKREQECDTTVAIHASFRIFVDRRIRMQTNFPMQTNFLSHREFYRNCYSCWLKWSTLMTNYFLWKGVLHNECLSFNCDINYVNLNDYIAKESLSNDFNEDSLSSKFLICFRNMDRDRRWQLRKL